MNFRSQSALLCVFVTASMMTSVVGSVGAEPPSWPQFLGPNRNGVSTEVALLDEWPATGPRVLWRAPGGVGMSAVAVSGKHVVTLWNSPDGQVVAALDSEQGTILWKTTIAPNYENGQGDGPRGTPAIAGGHVFAYSGEGTLACLDLESGQPVWSKNIVASVGSRPAEYGMACSPLVAGDLVIVTAGGRGTTVVACDVATGETKWTVGNGSPGYSSPALLDIAGEKQLVALVGSGVIGIRPEDGSHLWAYPFKTPYDCNTATPISVNGNVFISAGENHGCVMLGIEKTAGRFRVTEKWKSVDTKSVMRNEWQTSLFLDGHLYGFDNVGSAGAITHLTCVNADTGERVWRETRFGKGNLVAADGHLWMTTMKGELVLAQATPSGYVELGRKKLFGKTRQTPSIAAGRAFVRDDQEIVCIDIRG